MGWSGEINTMKKETIFYFITQDLKTKKETKQKENPIEFS